MRGGQEVKVGTGCLSGHLKDSLCLGVGMRISPAPDPHADNVGKTPRERLGPCEGKGRKQLRPSARQVWVLLFCA